MATTQITQKELVDTVQKNMSDSIKNSNGKASLLSQPLNADNIKESGNVQSKSNSKRSSNKDDDGDTGSGDGKYAAGRKKRQALGGVIFISYLVILFSTIIAAYYDLVPVFAFEKSTVSLGIDWAKYLREYMWVPFALSILYYVGIFGTEEILKEKEPFDLRVPLGLWSLFLAIFSFVGAVRTVPVVVKIISTKGVHHLICGDTRFDWVHDNAAGTWTLLFILSKVPELIDTVFIVLRKKSVITLHWYHHITVMLYCWHAWAAYCLCGIIFAAMNLTVHASMYFFYALTAFGYRPTMFAMSVTLGQIIQMVVGTAVAVYIGVHEAFIVPKKFTWSLQEPEWVHNEKAIELTGECAVNSANAFFGALMYFSYLLFFLYFFYRAYLSPNGKDVKFE